MLGVIADDITGASDTGLQFGKRGLRTVVLVDIPNNDLTELQGADVVVVDTDSRGHDAELAYRRVREGASGLSRLGISQLYKKIDSTLRGNIGAELDALLDQTRAEAALVAPAFPANGRTVVEGRLLVGGFPLEETVFASDPLWPARQSFIPSILAKQTSRTTKVISLDIVRAGPDRIAREIQQGLRSGIAIFVVDAVTSADLANTAHTLAQAGGRWVGVGSAGLAEGLPVSLGLLRAGTDQTVARPQDLETNPPVAATARTPDGSVPAVSSKWVKGRLGFDPAVGHSRLGQKVRPILVVVGSANPLAREQLALLVEARRPTVIEIDPVKWLQGAASLKGSVFGPIPDPFDQPQSLRPAEASDAGSAVSEIVPAQGPVPLSGQLPTSGESMLDLNELARVASMAHSALKEGRDVVIELAAPSDLATRLAKIASSAQLGDRQIALALVTLLGRVVSEVWAIGAPIGGLVLTGGDTARATCRALGVVGLSIEREVQPGIPQARLIGGTAGGLPVITKAGGFGTAGALTEAVTFLWRVQCL